MNRGSEENDQDHGLAYLTGGGELGARIQQFDWSQTTLGAPSGWPQSLRSVLSICVSSNFPIALYWGPDLVLLYNDQWSPILGKKHPWALGKPGREVSPDIWDIIEPLFARVLSAGEAVRQRDQLLPMQRHGYTEECYFDYTLSPIRNEGGVVEGVFNAVLETTTRVIGERRLRTLRELAIWRTGSAGSAEEACQNASQVIAENPHDIPFAVMYLLDGKTQQAHLAAHVGNGESSPADAATIDLTTADSPWPLRAVMETGRAVVVDSLPPGFQRLRGRAWPEMIRQAIVLPMARPGQEQLAGFLITGVSPRLALDDDYRGFFDLLAGHVAASVASARAYEEERQRAEALAELDRAKTAFFSNVSHEFRTPLSLILGPVEDLLVDQAELPNDCREQLQIAHRNGLRLQRLVNTLLDFSRIEAGRTNARYEPTDLGAFTADLASNFRSACERAGLALHVDSPPFAHPASVDRSMWEKIVLNLLSNAFKFTLEGEIRVVLRDEGDAIRLTVSDTGAGIPAEEMPRIFDRFHRIENARGRTHEGSGIGLALVQELVKLHDGTITADSALGEGTTFTVVVPRRAEHPPLAAVQTEEARVVPSGIAHSFIEEALRWLPDAEPKHDFRPEPEDSAAESSGAGGCPVSLRPRILVADDNADMRQYVHRLLADEYEVETASDGEAALVIIRDRPPDLLLSDVMMPNLDGFELVKHLRAEARTAGIPIILLSARAGEESRVEGVVSGADDYLVKPFAARELRARVFAHLQMAKLRRDANESLRASEERFELFMSHSPTTAYIKDGDGRYVYVNQLLEQQFNRPLADWLDKTDADFFSAEEAAAIRKNDLEVIRSGKPAQFIEVATHPDGVRQYFSLKFPLPDRKGNWLLAGMSLDITQQRRAEERERQLMEAAARANAQFRAFFEQGALFAGIMDVSGTLLEANRLSLEACGYQRENVIGKPFWECPWWDRSAELQEQIKAACAQAATGATFRGELTYFVADGSKRMVDLIILPVKDDEEAIMFLAPTGTDITDRKRAEQDLAEAHEFLHSSLDALSSHIAVLDEHGTILAVNDAWRRFADDNHFLGHNYGVGANYLSACEPDPKACVHGGMLEGLKNVLEGRLPLFEYEYPCHSPTDQRWFVMRATRFKSPGPVRVVVAHENVTKRKLAEEALKDADRKKDEFLATLAHELRNPLAPLRNGLHIMKLAAGNRDAVEQARTMMTRQLEQMVHLVDDLLDLSRISRGKIELRKARVNLVDVVQHAIETSRPAIDSAEHRLETFFPARSITVDADTTRLAQVFANLLNNAAKYTERGGRIGLVVEQDKGEAVVTVRDTGVGIPPHMLPEVFEMFTQVDRTLERSQGGLGIGLSIVKRLVAMHGGTVVVRSGGQGQGSEFEVRLPVAATADIRSDAIRHAGQPAGRRRILVVDDNQDSATSLALMLRLMGHETRTAFDGIEALDVTPEFQPDVVLLDIGMPRLNGYDTARRLREIQSMRPLTLIALTGWGQEDDRRKSQEAGFNSHLTKPVDASQLERLLADGED